MRITRATSSGWPQRGVAVMPSAIRPSYFAFDDNYRARVAGRPKVREAMLEEGLINENAVTA